MIRAALLLSPPVGTDRAVGTESDPPGRRGVVSRGSFRARQSDARESFGQPVPAPGEIPGEIRETICLLTRASSVGRADGDAGS